MKIVAGFAIVMLAAFLSAPAWAEDPPAFLLKWGSTGSGPGQFNQPLGIGVAPNGNVYVADPLNNRIQIFDNNGAFLAAWSNPGTDPGQFQQPSDVAFDAAGNIYVSDAGNQRIQMFDSSRTPVTYWDVGFSTGLLTLSPDAVYIYVTVDRWVFRVRRMDGMLTPWQFTSSPTVILAGIGTAPTGEIYVAAVAENVVRKLGTTGTQITQWGGTGTGDGQFNSSLGVAVDATDHVYVSDGNYRIQKFTSTGGFLSKWGALGEGDGEFGGVYDLAVDSNGNVFALDSGNDRVQKFGDPGTPVQDLTWGRLKARYR